MPVHEHRDTFDGTNATTFSHAVTLPSGLSELLVIIRHGQATDDILHSLVEWNGTALTQLGSEIDCQVTNPTRRRMSVWHLTDPEAGTFNITGSFSSQVAQYSVTVIGASASGAPDLTSLASVESQASGTNMVLDITPEDAGSLIYVSVMASAGTADPFAPAGQTDTEIEDSGSDTAATNHSFASGHGDVVTAGVAQSMGFTASASDEWGAVAVELPPAADDRITGRSVDIDFPTHTVTIESGV